MGRVRAISSGYTGGPGVSTFFFSVAVGDFDNVAAALAVDRVKAAYLAGKAMWPQTWTVSCDGIVDVIEPDSGDLVGTTTGTGWTMGGTGGEVSSGPAPVGLITRWTTSGYVNSRRVRGRTFHVPVIRQMFEDNGTVSTGGLTAANAFGGAMNSPGATDCIFGVWSRPVTADEATPGSPARAGSFWGCTGYGVPDKAVVLRSRRD